MITLYIATNKVNGKKYVGMTSRTLRQRRWEHLSAARKDSQYLFHKALRKYGEEGFEWQVVACAADMSQGAAAEIELITQERPAYNLTEGGEGVSMKREGEALRRCQETVRRAGEIRRQKSDWKEVQRRTTAASWQDPEVRARRVAGMYAAVATRDYVEIGKKISIANTGRKLTPEHCSKIRALKLGVKQGPELVLKRILAQRAGNIARQQGWLPSIKQRKPRAPISEATRERMRVAAILREANKKAGG